MSERTEWIYGAKGMASFLNVDERTVWRWLRDPASDFPARRVGGRWFALPADLTDWTKRGKAAA